ncbi:Lrp/AsnC family transcriptional regulator [Bosea sp. BIWAKO-01]|uniref:Lrp/AsnC family transcriptional regulator n=1 Tax=Bosea sp. BIWAKO-01 TaxID=506668 RepID=UPI0008536E77|nr:Lrp/AsnC family transcriptional regulator [Bosea sp. BIWAKO-01]GAU83117.1 transcriptional regulator of AsnC family [Bosea sp. BIWAKO-01]
MIELDRIDRRILAALQDNGRISTLELAEKVGLSPTPCSRRIKRLEDAGVIEGYSAQISPTALGFGICVMVSVKLAKQSPDAASQFMTAIQGQPEITECLLVTGNVDYLLRVWVRDIEALRTFISAALQAIPCVAETSTMVILDTQKSNQLLEIGGQAPGRKPRFSQARHLSGSA